MPAPPPNVFGEVDSRKGNNTHTKTIKKYKVYEPNQEFLHARLIFKRKKPYPLHF
jgi:hypothetical protein